MPRAARGDSKAAPPPSGRSTVFTPTLLEDLRWWVQTNPRIAERILQLVEAVRRDPFTGIGQPEPLRHVAPNTWSRRITAEHRLVYQVGNDRVTFIQARFHY